MGTVRDGSGFTLIELLVVIAIMGILLTVGVVAQQNLRQYATDRERADDAASIARRLEQSYTDQDLGTPSYPSTLELGTDAAARTRTMDGIAPDALSAPDTQGTVSIVPATGATPGAALPEPTATTYVYQPLTAAGALCSANPSKLPVDNCTRFFLYYRSLIKNQTFVIESIHQQ